MLLIFFAFSSQEIVGRNIYMVWHINKIDRHDSQYCTRVGKCNIFRYALLRRKQYGLLDLNNSGKAVRTAQVEMNKTLACSKCTLAQHVYLCILINNIPGIAALRKCARIRPKTVLIFLALVAISIKTFCARKKTNSISSLLSFLSCTTLPTNWSPISILWVSRKGGKGKEVSPWLPKKSPAPPLPKMAKSSQVVAASNYCSQRNGHPIYFKTERIPSGRATVVEVSLDI